MDKEAKSGGDKEEVGPRLACSTQREFYTITVTYVGAKED